MKHYCYIDSPIGRLLLRASDGVLNELHFPNSAKMQKIENEVEKESPFQQVIAQLEEYFKGERKSFELEILPAGTEFQQSVWQELQNIPYGHTASYSQIAQKIGTPKGCRAVGMANSRNPIPIIIPCHRVIGKNGTLTGFGGGLDTKKFLLDLETG